MIYYFSGTGNSQYVAEQIAELMGEDIRPLTCCDPIDSDSIGIIFPVYAWGLPSVVSDFIPKLKGIKSNYIWTVMTCGDDMGYADRVLNKELQKVGFTLHAAFSVQMPNTYVCLPGFDIDSDEKAENKVRQTNKRIPLIVEKLKNKERVIDVVRGPIPFTYTYILRPLFNKTLVTDRYFKVSDACVKCGKCTKECPLSNITQTTKDSLPQWSGNCTGCLRCYHLCPQHAIHFGSMTKNKGQKKKIKG